MFTIGAFARLSGVSAKALRAYDSLGLFMPAWVDRATAYRFYSAAQLPELRRIMSLRELGIGLAEIKRLVAGGADLAAALDRRRGELQRERELIDRRLAALDIHLDVGSGASPGSDVVVRQAPPQLVALLPMVLFGGADFEAAFYELESHVRDHRRRGAGPPGALIADDGTDEVFVPLTRTLEATDRITSLRLPAATLATVLVRGDYRQIAGARRALERWVERTGHLRTGELRILYLQFGAELELAVPLGFVVDAPADYVTELQQPVAAG